MDDSPAAHRPGRSHAVRGGLLALVAVAFIGCSRRAEPPGPERGQPGACGVATGATCAAPAAGDCQADVTRDPRHCGACGHDCLGGACVASACRPVVLAKGQEAAQIALDDAFAYWTNPAEGGRILRVARAGGAVQGLASGVAVTSIALGGESLLFSQGTSASQDVERMPPAGGAPTRILAGAAVLGAIAADASSVYVPVRASPWSALRVPIVGGPAAPLWSGGVLFAGGAGGAAASDPSRPLPTSLAACAARLVIAVEGTYLEGGGSNRDGYVVAVPTAGGAPKVLAAPLSRPRFAACDGARAYVATYDDARGEGAVVAVPLDGGAAVTLAHGVSTGLAVDATSVLWSSSDGLTRTPKAGGAGVVVAPQAAGPVAVDATAIVWAAPDGAGGNAILLLAK
jgi:hypothetical protein